MSKYNDVYSMVVELYRSKKYSDVVNKVDKYLSYEFKKDKFKYNMIFMKSKSLRYLGRFEEAINELQKLILIKKDDIHALLELYYIYYFLGEYEKALEILPVLYDSNDKYVSNTTLAITELVMRKHLGLPASFKKGTRSDYIKGQIVDYDEELAFNHINSHTHDVYSFQIHSRFNEDVDIKYLIECVKKQLKNSKKLNIIDVMDVYCFSISSIGYDDNSICNYLRVIVCPGTENIISMYPFAYVESENFLPLECDMDKLFKRDVKEKTISRIDKFNKRFNLK